MTQLNPNHAAQLEASAIADTIRRERGYWSATDPAEWARRDGDMADYQRRLPGLAYPVYRLGRAKPYTLILRPDDPRTEQRNGKPRTVKYEWPAGLPLCIDILPRYRDSLRDTAIPLWFTEGAKKADALASLGQSLIPASLNGVWCWRHKTADGTSVPLPDFDDLALKGRDVVLAFDSDQAENENVQRALAAFTKFLVKRGARVGNLKLPHSDHKLGVDDAIAQGWTYAQLLDAIAWADNTTSIETLAAQPQCTDYGNARRLVEQHGDDLRYVKEWGWMTWDGRRWELDRTGEAERRAKATVLSIYQEAAEAPEHLKKDLARHAIASQSSGKITSMLALAESEAELRARTDEFDTNDWLLTCINGTLDLRTGQLEPHDRRNMLTRAIDVIYDAQAACPGWLAFLDRIFAGDATLIAYVQRMIGYMLTGSTGAQCMFIAYGTGANGKSVLIEVIRALLGEYARNADGSTFTAQQSDRIRSDLARLAGVRFVSTVELDEGRRLSEALVKQIAGGDVITARFLHKDEFEFKPRFKLLLATNHKPVIRGTDYAIWRRIRLIPFTVTIPEAERDPQLAEKLQQELPGILAWAVHGCLDWQQHGLQEPDTVKAATNDYRSEMDVIGQYLGERCVIAPRAVVLCAALYTNYVKWCEESGERAVNQRRFGAQMTERGFERVRSTGGWRYVGVSIGADDIDPIDLIDPNSPISREEEFTSKKTGNQDQKDQLDQQADTSLRRLPLADVPDIVAQAPAELNHDQEAVLHDQPAESFRVVGGVHFAEARARMARQRAELDQGLPADYEEL
jgi:P4 family phage/plasmid primase-like protien